VKKMLIVALNSLALLACAPATTVAERYPPPPERYQPPPEVRWQPGTDWRPGIRDKITDIRKRINSGVNNGNLTRTEADRLRYDLDGILDELDRMKSDGYLSERERNRVVAQLNHLSDDVYRLKHNESTRY